MLGMRIIAVAIKEPERDVTNNAITMRLGSPLDAYGSDSNFSSSEDGLHRRNNSALHTTSVQRPRERRLPLPTMLIQIAKLWAAWLSFTKAFARGKYFVHN